MNVALCNLLLIPIFICVVWLLSIPVRIWLIFREDEKKPWNEKDMTF